MNFFQAGRYSSPLSRGYTAASMRIIFDSHVHLYPRHDEGLLLSVALRRLGQLAPGAMRAIILTERSECARFAGMLEKKDPPAGFKLEQRDEISITATATDGNELLIIAGRPNCNHRAPRSAFSIFGCTNTRWAGTQRDTGGCKRKRRLSGSYLGARKMVWCALCACPVGIGGQNLPRKLRV